MAARTAEPTTAAAITAINLSRRYGSGAAAVDALRDVTLTIPEHTFTAVMGPSGSGKSTLLHVLSGLDAPSAGSVTLGGTDITGLSERELTRLRRDRVGFVFQQFNLLPTLTAAENIALPGQLAGHRPDADRLARITQLLGITDRLGHLPAELSGGQQQRVAIARALLTDPHVVFADEPTGNLDRKAGTQLLELLRTSVGALGQTIVMVTHDPAAAAHADRVIFLADGVVADDLLEVSLPAILDRLDTLEQDAR